MKIAIFGGSGYLGGLLTKYFESQNIQVVIVGRSPSKCDVLWNFKTSIVKDLELLENTDVFINLTGANVGSKRWTKKRKNEILSSRVQSTELIKKLLENVKQTPKMYIGASAIGIYGSSDEEKDESSVSGEGFLVDVCEKWEEAHFCLKEKFDNFYVTRLGVVLGEKGGFVKELTKKIKLGIGGIPSQGSNRISWIGQKDFVRAIDFIIRQRPESKIINIVNKNYLSSEYLIKAIYERKKVEKTFTIPEFLIYLIIGKQKALETVYSDQRVIPAVLDESGFEFEQTNLKSVFRN